MGAGWSATGQLLFLPAIAEFTTRSGWRAALVLAAAAFGATVRTISICRSSSR
jgi:hypothetical protein